MVFVVSLVVSVKQIFFMAQMVCFLECWVIKQNGKDRLVQFIA